MSSASEYILSNSSVFARSMSVATDTFSESIRILLRAGIGARVSAGGAARAEAGESARVAIFLRIIYDLLVAEDENSR